MSTKLSSWGRSATIRSGSTSVSQSRSVTELHCDAIALL